MFAGSSSILLKNELFFCLKGLAENKYRGNLRVSCNTFQKAKYKTLRLSALIGNLLTFMPNSNKES